MQKKLHPGARWIFRFNAYSKVFALILALGVVIPLFLAGGRIISVERLGSILLTTLQVLLICIPTLFILVGELYARNAYKHWSYEFTNKELRTESGVIWKRYSTIPYSRIQNIDVTRGILAKWANFSSVSIQTAGYSSSYDTEGYLPAIDNDEAKRIRISLMKKIKNKTR